MIGRLSGRFETPRADNRSSHAAAQILVKRKKKGELSEKERKCEGYLYFPAAFHVPSTKVQRGYSMRNMDKSATATCYMCFPSQQKTGQKDICSQNIHTHNIHTAFRSLNSQKS